MSATDAAPGPRWTRTDRLCLAALLVVAAVPRFAASAGIGLVHFDEAAYALAATAVADGEFPRPGDPPQHLFSPPLFFGACGLVMRWFGTRSDLVLPLASALAGTLTVGAVFAAGRRWFGTAAGAAGALLLALSDFHVTFSRAGLTDAAFCLLLVSAVAVLGAAEEKKSLRLAVVGGVLTGLAWNTKYHGWLAIAIAGAALLPRLRLEERATLTAALLRLLVAAGVAVALYVPWYFYVDSRPGGYAALAEYQSGFLRPAKVLDHLKRHLDAQRHLDGWMGRAALPAALLLASALRPRRLASSGWTTLALRAAALALAGWAVGLTVTAAALAALGCVAALRRGPEQRCLPVAFLLVFSALTPLYVAYPRLLLPWLAAVALLAGRGLVALAPDPEADAGPAVARWKDVAMRWAPGLVAVAAGAVLVLRGVPEASDPWRPGRGFAVAAEAVRDATPAGRKVVVLGEPALVFSLRNLGVDADHVDRLTGVDTLVPAGEPFVLVLGRYGRVVGRTQAWIDAHPAAVPETGRVAVDLGGVTDVRLLDDFRPYAAREVRRSGERPYELVLRSGTAPLGFE